MAEVGGVVVMRMVGEGKVVIKSQIAVVDDGCCN